jgi:hypothetical protein
MVVLLATMITDWIQRRFSSHCRRARTQVADTHDVVLVLVLLDRDVELDAEAAVVADATHVVAHAGEVERDDHWAAVAEGPVGVAGGALPWTPAPRRRTHFRT